MPVVVDVKIKGLNEVRNYLNKLPRKTDKIGNREAWNLTQFGASAIYQSALTVLHPWRGTWLKYGKGIDPRKLGEGRYGIHISQFGIYQDQMRPHFVPFGKGYKHITAWAKDKGKHKGKGIWVRPHPFIRRGWLKMLNRLHNITANRIANRIVK